MNQKLSIVLTCGAWGLILAAAIAFFLLGQGSVDEEENLSQLRECSETLETLSKALKTYTTDNKGNFPCELEDLVRKGVLNDIHLLSCPSKQFHYVYTGEKLNVQTVSPDMPVVFDRINNHRLCINILFADFRVRTVPLEKPSYSSLTPLIEKLTPEEQKVLRQKFDMLDKIFFLK